MARQPMVTRTITTTRVKALVVDITTSQTSEKDFVLPRTYKDDISVLKTAEKMFNTEAQKIVHIISAQVETCLYGMSENEFVQLAKPLPAREANNDNE